MNNISQCEHAQPLGVARQGSSRARLLFLSDTHLGLDWPLRPGGRRRRRGPEFFEAFDRALEPAMRGEVDAVLHGGDIFFRSRVRPVIVEMALQRVLAVSERGIPQLFVPGNHERSAIPLPLLWSLPGVRIFDRPRTFRLPLGGMTVAFSGFPCCSHDLPREFPQLLADTGWERDVADLRFLSLHQIVEGATVGPANHLFRGGAQVIPGRQLPAGFAAVLCGHIHRYQVLDRDLHGRPFPCPVLYPGSTCPTSFAEKDEEKGYLVLETSAAGDGRSPAIRWAFHPLPARPMVDVQVYLTGRDRRAVEEALRERLAALDPQSIVRLTVTGIPGPAAAQALRAERLRSLAPPEMNIEMRWKAEPSAPD